MHGIIAARQPLTEQVQAALQSATQVRARLECEVRCAREEANAQQRLVATVEELRRRSVEAEQRIKQEREAECAEARRKGAELLPAHLARRKVDSLRALADESRRQLAFAEQKEEKGDVARVAAHEAEAVPLRVAWRRCKPKTKERPPSWTSCAAATQLRRIRRQRGGGRTRR